VVADSGRREVKDAPGSTGVCQLKEKRHEH
jgi:hypothetical protein